MALCGCVEQIQIGVVNGRISERSFQRWRLPVLRQFAHNLVRSFSMVLCQNEQVRCCLYVCGNAIWSMHQ